MTPKTVWVVTNTYGRVRRVFESIVDAERWVESRPKPDHYAMENFELEEERPCQYPEKN